MLSLFGTAIGAGVLFLPISAGMGGLIPLIVILILAYPLTFLTHRGLCRFVLSDKNPSGDITEVAGNYFGKVGGFIVTLIYFFAIFPIVLIYSVGIVNTLISFVVNQMHYKDFGSSSLSRIIISLILVGILMIVSYLGENVVTKIMSYLVYPFIAFLIIVALFLIPQWNTALFEHISFSGVPGGHGFWFTLWLVIPVMVFSFNHSPIISSLAVHEKKRYGEGAEKKSSKIISRSNIIMVVVVMFFTFSCALCLTPHDFVLAKEQNISILSYVANKFNAPILEILAPIVAFVAMSKSFLGHYLGAREGFNGIVRKASGKNFSDKSLNIVAVVIMFLIAWYVAYKNPNILNIIEGIGGLVLVAILFLMPIYAIWRYKALKAYRNIWISIFVVVFGVVAISAAIYGLIFSGI
ncbi:serine/threonine protein kinase [Helicobacter sp. 13S00401-1]|uniref:amino acid permease n=1 Tax=Helicobacter sp. 13S00401-1 TaxID=1905758 RepID=UPI000BA634E5|nr:amino acid permease [Helicobacter sp. 13S00401-1]PAF51481.1 serine/threonine protein kinase [Helicobacter sp. 13S00401-1]